MRTWTGDGSFSYGLQLAPASGIFGGDIPGVEGCLGGRSRCVCGHGVLSSVRGFDGLEGLRPGTSW